ncbi:HAMP domain-containing histidine kinase [Ktedonosporobacter rubrisoli]|uniref:histidine kinase n=1 Tax=Ktedonosporobacter rubrisoli TaxID=2509675 RepID=A0A4P6JV72_KTERU|nr:HAMP domain-containing sensor histidine kinase [Ktedonosporobacter rubrisoli]QBD79232.1 HAMP domain-containing histidine kinase [Ktedonosporobacter rubrisoli]
MRIHNISPIPASFLHQPTWVRLMIIVLSLPISLGIYMLVYPHTHNGTSLVIPLILAAWFYGYKGIARVIPFNLAGIISVNSLMVGTIYWPQQMILSCATGVTGGALVGLVVSYLRATVDAIEEARQQALRAEQERARAEAQRVEAMQAERLMMQAYEHQLQLHQMKDQFMLHVNHELRTPLTEVYGYLELMSMQAGQLDKCRQEMFIQKAMDSCEELIHLVNNILAAANASKNIPTQIEEIPLEAIIQEALGHFKSQVKQAYKLDIDVPASLSVRADRQYLVQVLHHLLANAFKYPPPQSTITIKAGWQENKADPHQSQQVCISISDNGPGIAPDEMPQLFESFVRLRKHQLSGTLRGSGLGLYICKQLIEAMGGKIWAESSGIPGEGCCFHFILPGPIRHALPPQETTIQGE